MSFQDQLLKIYLTNLEEICDNNRLANDNDEEDPALYNALFQLHKYYSSINKVPEEDKKYLYSVYKYHLLDIYNDHLEDCVTTSFDNFLLEWKNEKFNDAYGGNDSYNVYLLILNTLKNILRLY